MLEVIGVNFTAVNNIVGLNIVGVFLYINGDILFLKNIGNDCKDGLNSFSAVLAAVCGNPYSFAIGTE